MRMEKNNEPNDFRKKERKNHKENKIDKIEGVERQIHYDSHRHSEYFRSIVLPENVSRHLVTKSLELCQNQSSEYIFLM